MRPGSRLPLLTIAILVVLILQQRTPLIPPALALRGLNDSTQLRNGSSLPIKSNATANLPDPSNCENPETTHMGNFFSATSGKSEQHNHGTDAVEQPSLESNSSKEQNLTHIPGSPSIHAAAGSSIARDQAVHVMDLDKAQDVLWINEPEQLAGSTPPPGETTIHTAAQSSVARESVQVLEMVEAEALISVSSERLGRATPPPIDTSIHTAGQRSVARESLQLVLEMSEDGINDEEQLGASTPPPGVSDIHTASQSSVARDSNLPDESQLFNTLRR